MTIDLESAFRSKIDSILIAASWMESIRRAVDITGVSQIWTERPAWYFWLTEAPGVYELELVDTNAVSDNDVRWYQAGLRLKCYPFVDADVFGDYSYEERCLVKSPYFDETHTPCFESRQRIPANLFTVGALSYTIDHEESVAAFTLESLDTWQTTFGCNTSIYYPLLKKSKTFKKGTVGRQVPGTRIAALFFDRFLCLFSAFCQHPPEQVRSASSIGFEYIGDRTGHFLSVESSNNRVNHSSVLYALSETPAARQRILNLVGWFGTECEDVIYDRTHSCCHSPTKSRGDKIPPPLNSLWWTLAHEEHRTGIGFTCGCG